MVVATINEYDFSSASDLNDWAGGTRTLAQGSLGSTNGYYMGAFNQNDYPSNWYNNKIPGQSNEVTVSFDIYELDFWSNFSNDPSYNERLNFRIWEENESGGWDFKEIEIGDFATNVNATSGTYFEVGQTTWTDQGVTITRNTLPEQDINGTGGSDQLHEFTLTFDTDVTLGDRGLDFSFLQTENISYGNGSYGVDNFKIEADTNYLSDDAYEDALTGAQNMDVNQGSGVTSSLSQLTSNLNTNLNEASNWANQFNNSLRGENISDTPINGTVDLEIDNTELETLFDDTIASLETWGKDGEMGDYVTTLWQQMNNSNAPTPNDLSGLFGSISAITYMIGSIAGGVSAATTTGTTFASAVGAGSYLAGSAAGTANNFYEAGEADYFDDDNLTGLTEDLVDPGAGADTLIFELGERGFGNKKAELQDAAEDAGIGLGNLYQNYKLAQLIDERLDQDNVPSGDDGLMELTDPDWYASQGLGFDVDVSVDTVYLGRGARDDNYNIHITSAAGPEGAELNGVSSIYLRIEEEFGQFSNNRVDVEAFDINFA